MITLSTSAVKRTYHHGDLRDALLTAALAILEESGEAGALSLRETARRAGVSAMAPYRHFADKDALVAAVATIGFERFAKALGAADLRSNADKHEALIAQGVAYMTFALENPALFRLMFGANAPAREGDLADAARVAYTVLATRVATLVPPNRAADQTLAAWSLAHGLTCLAVDGRLAAFGESPTDLAARILRSQTL